MNIKKIKYIFYISEINQIFDNELFVKNKKQIDKWKI